MSEQDKLDGQEQGMIGALLATFYPLAKAGDKDAADKVIKLLQLRRAYKRDRLLEEVE